MSKPKPSKTTSDSCQNKKKRNLEMLEEQLDLLDTIKRMVDAAVDKKLQQILASMKGNDNIR